MDDGLAGKLYTKWRSEAPDPNAIPVWGNVDAMTREQWQHVAGLARGHMREQIAGYLDAEARELDVDDEAGIREGMQRAAALVRPK